MTNETPESPAGWYPAPHAGGEIRYWDGTKWLDIVPPSAAETQVISAPAESVSGDSPTTDETSGSAAQGESAGPDAPSFPAAPVEQPRAKTGIAWWGWALIGVGAIAAVVIVGSLLSPKTPSAAASKSPTSAAESPAAEEPAYTPTPVTPEAGSLENPWPAGHTAELTSSGEPYYSVTAVLVSANANDLMHTANQFNDAPPAGSHYVLVEYTFTGESDSAVDPGSESFEWQVADQDGRLYQHETAVTPGKSLTSSPDIYKGQTYTGQAAYIVPDTASKLYVSTLGKYISLQ